MLSGGRSRFLNEATKTPSRLVKKVLPLRQTKYTNDFTWKGWKIKIHKHKQKNGSGLTVSGKLGLKENGSYVFAFTKYMTHFQTCRYFHNLRYLVLASECVSQIMVYEVYIHYILSVLKVNFSRPGNASAAISCSRLKTVNWIWWPSDGTCLWFNS